MHCPSCLVVLLKFFLHLNILFFLWGIVFVFFRFWVWICDKFFCVLNFCWYKPIQALLTVLLIPTNLPHSLSILQIHRQIHCKCYDVYEIRKSVHAILSCCCWQRSPNTWCKRLYRKIEISDFMLTFSIKRKSFAVPVRYMYLASKIGLLIYLFIFERQWSKSN